jgi:4-hydroxybenzoate polyprenyltransferase
MNAVVVVTSPVHDLWRKACVFAESIKIEHTVFSFPFAYLTLFLVEDGLPGAANFGWLTLAMASARTLAMAANRLIDAGIDAANPRTAQRAIPAGRLRVRDMTLFMAVSLGLFLLAVYNLSPKAQYLWPIAVAPMILYPYLKRFTWLCHFGISSVYLIVPPAVWIAVANDFNLGSVLLGVGAGLWVAGFDVIYAAQDINHDRKHGLHSIPADFGLSAGLLASRLIHLGAVGLLVAAGPYLGVGWLYYLGTVAFLLLLAHEHRIVSPGDMGRINVAFFNMNGVVSIVFFLFVMADVLLN